MAFDQSFYNHKINVMVVDDDPVFLQVVSRMLEKFKYRDTSTMEITVIAVTDPIEALSTLKIQRNKIDLVVTDYYMPRMNGVQLKQQVTQEFGNMPVIADSNKEHESLACGAKCFLPKPIKPIDLSKIYQVALTFKRKDRSILWTEHNHKETDVSISQQIQLLPEQANVLNSSWTENNHTDTDVSIPQQIQLLPGQANVLKTKKKRFSRRSSSRPVNSSNGSYVSTDGSGKNRKRKSNGGPGDDSRPLKKPKMTWSNCLHHLFLQAIQHIGLDKAVPKKILEFMNLPYLTRENIASHLQKYRLFLRKVAEQGSSCSRKFKTKGIESIFLHAHLRDPYYNNYTPSSSSSWYDTSINNRPFYSKPGQGLGQSRLLSNTIEPVRFDQRPYNYMNRSSSTYEPRGIGSNLTLPTKSNLSFPTLPFPNEGRRSLFEPTVMANETGQSSQFLGFGQHGNDNSFNNNMMSSYGSSSSNQPRVSSHTSLTPTQYGMSSYESLTSNQPGMSSYGILSPNQPGLNSFGSVTHNTYESLTPNQPGPSNFWHGMNLFLSNENTAYNPQPHANATTQPNLDIPQLENLSLSDYIGNTDELPCDISNFQFDHNQQQQEEALSTTIFKLPANFETELNEILSLDENGDWNINQGNSDGETSNIVAAPEMNSPIFNMNPNHDQEQDVPGFVDWSSLDPKDLTNEYDNFMDYLFNNDMN